MEVILEENYPQLGFVGDRVVVKNGFARNYLIPRGIASEVTSRNARMLEHKLAGIQAKKAKLKTEAEEFAGKFSSVKLAFKLKLGEQGKSFGSVTTRDMQAQLVEKGYDIERKQLTLLEPIRTPGTYEVKLQLHSDVIITLPVEVTGEKSSKSAKDTKREASEEDAEKLASEIEEFEAAVEDGDASDDSDDSEETTETE